MGLRDEDMSTKNQKTLFISASVIIMLTVFSLVGLNLAVEKISNIRPPSLNKRPPGPPSENPASVDDALVPMKKPGLDMKKNVPPMRDEMKGFGQDRMMPVPGKRVRNGRDAPDFKQMESPMMRPPSNGTKREPPPSSPPPRQETSPSMPNMEQQREMYEREMERQREMYENGPPGGYYPPPGYEDAEDFYYEDYYDYPPDYYEDPDLEGHLDYSDEEHEEDDENTRLTDSSEAYDEEYEDEFVYDAEEDYEGD